MRIKNPDLNTEDLMVQPVEYWKGLLKSLTPEQRAKVKKEVALEFLRRQLRRLPDKDLMELYKDT